MSEKQRTREYLKQVIKLSIPAVLAQISSIIMQGGMAHLRGRKRTGVDQEIPGSIPPDLFRSAQPDRKI